MKVEKCFGIELKQEQFKQFNLSLTQYNAGESIDYHQHKLPYLSLNVHGQYLEDDKKQLKNVCSGDLISRSINYSHRNKFTANSNLCFNIEFSDPGLYDQISSVFNDGFSLNFIDSRSTAYRLMHSFLKSGDDSVLNSLMRSFMDLNKINLDLSHEKYSWLKKLINYIQEHWDKNLTLAELSDIACVSKNYMVRAFKAKIGITIGEFQRRVRLNNMLPEIMNYEQSLTSTAYVSGYYDQSHMIKHFNTYLECNPLELRTSIKRFI
tara:strand:- start:104 stop:898 length:795 start_codon:yes stop_codon:yes gene_type:complete